MKISKLFHWLYAILMLLPFAFFIPSVFYYAFNDNATMQAVEVPKTETIAVDFNQKIDLSSSFDCYNATLSINDNVFNITNITNGLGTIFNEDFVCVENHKYLFSFNVLSFDGTPSYRYRYPYITDFTSLTLGKKQSIGYWNTGITEHYYGVQLVPNYTTYIELDDFQMFDLTQMFGVGNEPSIEQFNLMFPNDYYSYTESELMSITYDTGETEQLVENTSIINYAWESVWDLPLFSWTKVTFVSVPFAFITGIFGVASSSSLNYVFGYFATISIVWLLFDVILFLPMLAHRWIDKARIE